MMTDTKVGRTEQVSYRIKKPHFVSLTELHLLISTTTTCLIIIAWGALSGLSVPVKVYSVPPMTVVEGTPGLYCPFAEMLNVGFLQTGSEKW